VGFVFARARRQTVREVIESVKKCGIQQPIIARPDPSVQGEYEIIDGVNRRDGIMSSVPGLARFAVGEKPKILVDIRYGINDSEMFKLSQSFHTRGERNTYEQAEFYVKWIDAKAKELGKKEGASTEVAKELVTYAPDSPMYSYALNSKQSSLSQYCRIYEMFQKLEQKYPGKDFNILKSLAINKLYELTKLTDNLPTLVRVVEKLLKNPDMSLDRLRELTKGDRIIERDKIPWSTVVRIPPKESKQLHDVLYRLNSNAFHSEMTNNEMIRRAVMSLIRIFLENPSEYEPEVEKVPRKGYEFKCLWRKREIPKALPNIRLIPIKKENNASAEGNRAASTSHSGS
jgi:hypothetical protein